MRVAVALSGGMDSAVSAHILKKRGYEVCGYHLLLHEWSDPGEAIQVARKLDIPLRILDFKEEFRKKIVDYFLDEYRSGRTPNPCYFCNREIKFGLLMVEVLKDGCEGLATGHYARVERGYLYRAFDKKKDQSYFLSSLKKHQLERALFPLGNLTKAEVRKIALSLGIHRERESQDVCFLGGKDVREYLREKIGERDGVFTDEYGRELGKHRGYYTFTIGQRRGLGISAGKRLYVGEIRADTGEVVLVEKRKVMFNSMVVTKLNELVELPSLFNAQVKIRSNFNPVECEVRIVGDRAHVRFERPVFAVTPGQIAVFYDGDLVLGSGVIEKGIIDPVEG